MKPVPIRVKTFPCKQTVWQCLITNPLEAVTDNLFRNNSQSALAGKWDSDKAKPNK